MWGDSEVVALPNVGLIARIATRYVERSRPDDPRVAVEPHVRVQLSSSDWFAGRDPVLAAAIALR